MIEQGPPVRRGLLLGLVVGVPIVLLRGMVDPFGIPKVALLTVGVAVVLLLRIVEILQGSPSAGLRRLVIPAGLLAIPLVLSWILSPYREWALLGVHGRLQGLLPYLLIILLGVLLADAFEGCAAQLALALAWAGAIVGAYAAIQTVGLDPFQWSLFGSPTDAVSTTGNPNFTGGFLGITLPVALGLVLHDPGRRRIAIRLLALILLGWFLARSQGGWAAGVAGSAVVLGHWAKARHRLAPIGGLIVAGAIAVGVVGFVLLAMFRPDSRFATSASIVRARWWEAAASMGIAHPIAGRGPDSFGIEGVRHRTVADALEFNFDFPTDPHSVAMAMFANLGVLGVLGFIGIFAWLLWRFHKSRETPTLGVAFFAAGVAYLVQSIVSIDEISLRTALWTSLAGFVVAVDPANETAVGARAKPPTKKRSQMRALLPLRYPAAAVIVCLLAVGAITWAGSILVADAKVRKGSQQIAAGDIGAGRASYASALSLNDWADYRGRLGFQLARVAQGEEDEVDADLAAAAREAFAFTDEVPYVFSIVGRARILEAAAADRGIEDEDVVELYRRARSYDPLNPLIRVELARVLLRHDDPDAALAELVDLHDEVGPRYPEFWGVEALAAAELGNEALAREAIQMADSLSPGQPDAAEALKILESST